MSAGLCFGTAADLTLELKAGVKELRREADRRKRRERRKLLFSQLWYRDYFLHESTQLP